MADKQPTVTSTPSTPHDIGSAPTKGGGTTPKVPDPGNMEQGTKPTEVRDAGDKK